MTEKITLDSLERDLVFFNKMYEMVRIVDPIEKQVLEYSEGKTINKNSICYSYWASGTICDNCISIRAYREDKSYFKLEQGPDRIMMVTAIPIDGETPIVLELLKDATDSMMVGTGEYNEGHMMIDMVARLNDLVVKDPLTSLYNRRYIDERLPVDIVKATIEKLPISVIFMDVDNLKHINDEYDHRTGDLILKQVGSAIQHCIRSGDDWAARYGGDEFLICLNDTNNKGAYHVANRIRDSIEKISIPIKDDKISITISMGIHTMDGDAKFTAEEMIKYADHRMYEGKRQGKNAIVGDLPLKSDIWN